MKVLVCGGRTWGVQLEGKPPGKTVGEQQMLFYSLHSRGITEVIHGGAPGADSVAGQWARANRVKETPVKADWQKFGRAAGPIRNAEMLKLKPDLVIALPGGKGTENMIKLSRAAGVKVEIVGFAGDGKVNES